MSEIDFEALAAEELPAGESVTDTTGEGTAPDLAENTETGETTDSDGAGDDAGETDEADEQDQQEDDEPKRRRPSGSERARRQIDALKAENEALRAAQQAPSRAGSGGQDFGARVVAEIGEPPKESDYAGDFLAFERAQTVYETQKAIVTRELKRADTEAETRATRATETAKTAADEHMAALVEDHHDRLRDLEKASPGSVAKINAALQSGKLAPSDALLPLLLDSEKSGLLALYLAERPEKVAELNRLPPGKAEREIGRLEGRLSLPKPKTATTAPTPVRPLKGAAAPASPDRDLDAWMAKQYGA